MIGRKKKGTEAINDDIRIGRFSDFPEWVEAKGKLDILEAELRDLPEKIYKTKIRVRDYLHRKEIDAQVDALLNGEAQPAGPDAEEIYRLEWKEPILRRAIDKQRMMVAEIESRLSREICEAIKPDYERRARTLVECAQAFQEAIEAEAAIREELILHDIRFTSMLPPCCVDGNRRQPVLAAITALLNNARVNGYFNEERAS